MIFTASRTELLSGISTAIRAVPAHTTMSIMECLLIEAGGNTIRFTGNDTEMGIETTIPAVTEEPGTIAVEAKMLSEIIRKLPEDLVRFEADENYYVTITCGKAKFGISGRSAEEFSYLPAVEKDESISISQFMLKSMIQQTIFSVSSSDTNKMMTGEYFEVKNDILRLVALDGHRIAMRRVALGKESPERAVIVPGKTLLDISRIVPGEIDEAVTIFFSRNHIVFEIPGTRVVSRLIDGEYFSVDHMISTDYETKITVNRQLLISCVDRATLFVREGDKKPIIIEIDDDELRLSIDSQLGSMNDELEALKEGRNMTIGFNPRFLLDALRAVDDEEVTLYMVNPKAPCLIRDEDEKYTYLILPVNFVR